MKFYIFVVDSKIEVNFKLTFGLEDQFQNLKSFIKS